MCVQRSVYCSNPYTEGFEYAIKMRERKDKDGDMNSYFNPYSDDSLCKKSFEDGYRDGLHTSLFHGMVNF